MCVRSVPGSTASFVSCKNVPTHFTQTFCRILAGDSQHVKQHHEQLSHYTSIMLNVKITFDLMLAHLWCVCPGWWQNEPLSLCTTGLWAAWLVEALVMSLVFIAFVRLIMDLWMNVWKNVGVISSRMIYSPIFGWAAMEGHKGGWDEKNCFTGSCSCCSTTSK